MSYPNYHNSCSTPACGFSLHTWVDSASPKDLDCSKQPTAALCCRCDVSWWGSLYCLLHCLLLGPQKCRKAGSGGTSPLGNMSFNCFSQWSMRLASHCSSLWAAVPKCHVLVARDCPTSYLNMLGWFFTCVFFRLALLLNTNSPSPLPLPCPCLWCHLPDVLSVFICWSRASYSWMFSVHLWYLMISWKLAPLAQQSHTSISGCFLLPKAFSFPSCLSHLGELVMVKITFFPQQPKFNSNLWPWLTPHLSVWVLSCKKMRRAVQSGTHSQEWRAVGMGTLVSSSHLGQQRFAVANMRLFCKLLICTSIWGRFFICSRWAVIVSYLPSLVFLSFISNQTISALLAKLYIVSHSCFLQTQYPPWPILAGFHLHCCVYSFYKLLFQH